MCFPVPPIQLLIQILLQQIYQIYQILLRLFDDLTKSLSCETKSLDQSGCLVHEQH